MKVILPVYNQRVSPVFDWSMKALIVDIRTEEVIRKEEIDLSGFSWPERVKLIEKMGTRTLLCGGISLQLEGIISFLGIDVISWLSGNVDDIIGKFIKGDLYNDDLLMPGAAQYRARLEGMQINK